eukprot:3282565-Amphidinium_carterae.1
MQTKLPKYFSETTETWLHGLYAKLGHVHVCVRASMEHTYRTIVIMLTHLSSAEAASQQQHHHHHHHHHEPEL